MRRNKECLSLGCDEVPLFWGRSPVDMYRDFMDAFANAFQHMFGSVITEITVGLGPAGELRYPSYPEGDARWGYVCVCACVCVCWGGGWWGGMRLWRAAATAAE